MEAPGTYHHSMMVANLAELAADEVGANSVVDRNLKPWTIYHGNPVKKVGMREKPTEASMKAIEGMDWTKHF